MINKMVTFTETSLCRKTLNTCSERVANATENYSYQITVLNSAKVGKATRGRNNDNIIILLLVSMVHRFDLRL